MVTSLAQIRQFKWMMQMKPDWVTNLLWTHITQTWGEVPPFSL